MKGQVVFVLMVACLTGAASKKSPTGYEAYLPWNWFGGETRQQADFPLVVSQWEFSLNSTQQTFDLITKQDYELLDAVEESLRENCELEFCSQGVGPFWKIDEQGDLSLDAMVMDGSTFEIGAVANLRHVRNAIGVARAVMKYTKSTLITGDQATEFAQEMGFTVEDIRTNETETRWEDWKDNNCQPNFRQNVSPDPELNCGPYAPNPDAYRPPSRSKRQIDPSHITGEPNHDTICQIVVGSDASSESGARVVVGTTTNGLDRKIPGRVGDTPIPGAGAFADSEVGAAAATGNGDIMMRTLPSYQAVAEMRAGLSPTLAAEQALKRILKYFPDFGGALITANVDGEYGAACTGYTTFQYTVQTADMEEAEHREIECDNFQELPDNGSVTRAPATLLLALIAGVWAIIM